MSNEIIRSLEFDMLDLLQEQEKLVLYKEKLEIQRANKIQELQNEKQALLVGQVNQENLLDRNEEVRRKFSVLDVLVKNDSDKISEEMKNYLKYLNVKASIEHYGGDINKNFLEVKLEFPEIKNGYLKFIYDPATEDFELSALNPLHKNFQAMKDFLRSTGDIAGFISNYRKYAAS